MAPLRTIVSTSTAASASGVLSNRRAASVSHDRVQVGLDLVDGDPATDHQGEREDSPRAVPDCAGWVVDEALGATQCGGERCTGVGRDRPVRGQQDARGEVGQPVQGSKGGGDRVGPVERHVYPSDVVVRQRVPDHEQPLIRLPQRQVAGGVTRRGNDLPVGVAEPEDLPVVERHVDGVRTDRYAPCGRLGGRRLRRLHGH